jgi:CRP-like cAMP-binding protein
MADKVRKFKERATRYLSKGKLDDALEQYEKVIKLAPKDLQSRQKIAEIHARMGNKKEAVIEYQRIAGSYAADGLLLKSIAICKVILQLDPDHDETQRTLADLYGKRQGPSAPVKVPKTMSAGFSRGLGAKKGGKKVSASMIRGAPVAQIKLKPKVASQMRPPKKEEALVATPEEAAGTQQEIEISQAPPNEEAEAPHTAEEVPSSAPISLTALAQAGAAGLDDDSLEISVDQIDDDDDDDDLEIIEDDDDDEGVELEVGEDEIIEDEPSPADVDVGELPPIPLFSDLEQDVFISLLHKLELKSLATSEMLFAEGEAGSSMYIIVQGKLRVLRESAEGQEITLAIVGEGSFIGEMALLNDMPRTATIVAEDDCLLLELDRKTYEGLAAEHPAMVKVMKRFYKNRLIANLLRTSPVFLPFSPDEKKNIIEKFKSRNLPRGKDLLTKGETGDGLYVLLSGRCEVLHADGDGTEVVLAELKEGDVFGEMSMLTNEPVSATIRAITPCVVLRLPKRDFGTLIMTHPQVLETVSRLSDARRKNNADLLGDQFQDTVNNLVL